MIAILHDMDFVAENFERVIIMAPRTRCWRMERPGDVFMQDEALKRQGCRNRI